MVSGVVLDAKTKDTLVGAVVFNLNTVRGAVTDAKGSFEIPVTVSDTLMIEYLGYQKIKLKVTGDLLKVDGVNIEIYEKTQQIDPVTVKSHNLVGVLEIDLKQVPVDRYNRIHIRGLKQTYEVGAPTIKILYFFSRCFCESS